LDNLPEAIKYYQKSLTEHRTADILTKLQETEKLKEVRDREAYQNPELADEARNKGNELFKVQDYAGAVPFYTESIKRAEKDPRGYSNRAACYMKLMALNEAMNDVDKAISLDPTFGKYIMEDVLF
jgi:stress-induced-phosphoprotein 1